MVLKKKTGSPSPTSYNVPASDKNRKNIRLQKAGGGRCRIFDAAPGANHCVHGEVDVRRHDSPK